MIDADARKRAAEILKNLQYTVKDSLFRLLWKEQVKADVLGSDWMNFNASEWAPETREELADAVAERYCFEGDYDCNLSYWNNIDNLCESTQI